MFMKRISNQQNQYQVNLNNRQVIFAIYCAEDGVSLRGGSTANEGNLFVGNQPVCDADWDLVDAHVVCRMLG